jgi:hypothetical protein
MLLLVVPEGWGQEAAVAIAIGTIAGVVLSLLESLLVAVREKRRRG